MELNVWEHTNNRFVIFIDIMGFKDFVARHNHEEVYEKMLKLSSVREIIEKALNEAMAKEYSNKVYSTSFSDSIIIFSKSDDLESFKAVSIVASILFSSATINSVPMKGAFAYGKISVNRDKQIYFGQPLIDAYLLQEEVNYYGIVSHNSVDKYLLINKDKINDSNPFFQIKTPLKNGFITHNNLNWFEFLSPFDKFNEKKLTDVFTESMENLKALTSGSPRKYIDNTIDVFNQWILIAKG